MQSRSPAIWRGRHFPVARSGVALRHDVDLEAFFVTVDPERDTPETIDSYVSWVSDRITGVTGTSGEIGKMVKAWGVVAEKVPGEGADYTMNHTASVFLINRRGEYEGTIAYGEDMDTALAKIRKLIAES